MVPIWPILETVQKFVGFLEYGRPWKIASEINWPLKSWEFSSFREKEDLSVTLVSGVTLFSSSAYDVVRYHLYTYYVSIWRLNTCSMFMSYDIYGFGGDMGDIPIYWDEILLWYINREKKNLSWTNKKFFT